MPGRLSALRARAREIPAGRVDLGLAVLVVLGTLLEASLTSVPWPARLAAAGPGALVAIGVFLRRRRHITAIAFGGAGLAAANFLVFDVWEALQTPYFAQLLIVYAMAARETRAGLARATVACVVGVAVITATQRSSYLTGTRLFEFVAALGFFVLAPILAGRLLHRRLALTGALEEKAEQAATLRRAGAEEAVNAERGRIASELHDLVAHALGAMTIQASAARRLAAKDATLAAGAFEAIETTGRDALGELRVLLDVLRSDEPESAPEPQPTLASLPVLVERARGHGLGVTLDVQGLRPEALPTSVDLTAYRVVQDALRAAREDGGAGSATVRVRYRAERIEIEISDDGFRVADRRLLGLRERVRLYGGEVSTSAERGGGHVVTARLPLEGVPA